MTHFWVRPTDHPIPSRLRILYQYLQLFGPRLGVRPIDLRLLIALNMTSQVRLPRYVSEHVTYPGLQPLPLLGHGKSHSLEQPPNAFVQQRISVLHRSGTLHWRRIQQLA